MAVKVGILGFAHGHVNAYCAHWQQHPEDEIEIVAGWDHDPARLAQQTGRYAIPGYALLADFLAHSGMQAVVIGGETSLHAALVEQAAAAGKAIALQKPISLTLAEADRIVAAVERYAVPFTMAWQMRVDPQNLQIKQVLESGVLGKISMMRRRHGLPAQLWDTATMWHFDPVLNRDIWADDSAHPIDFIQWLLGVPESVTAELWSHQLPNDHGVALFRYASGVMAEVSCSYTCLAAENTTEIIGLNGSLVQNYGDVPSCNVPRPADAPGLKWYTGEQKEWTISDIPSPAGHGVRIAGLAGPLADFFHGRRPPISTAEEARTSLRMTLACYLSSQEGCRVRLDDPRIAAV
ncbi:MAG TPA: Gfo/Idh/MocA family oxidoreductase [Caldilineaceae bacterium]|nr:Gfo/Idh/MocA family oxidoreductase [Caldilineaceae bacterium]